jgi:putative endopeptidase
MYIYIHIFFNNKIKENIEEMIINLKNECINYVKNIYWMEDDTKKEAIKKLQYMKYKVGYPNKIERYEKLILTNNFAINLTNIVKYLFNKLINKYNNKIPVDKDEWFMGAFEVNAYYTPSFNELVIPAGILQEPFYSLKQSDIENLAGIGCVICHEIIHSLDQVGRKFDSNGNKRNWWTKNDEKMYNKMSQRLIKQYNNYKILGKNLNGKFTFGENFADLLGFYLAYQYCLKNYNSKEDKIKFFTHFAIVEKGKKTDKALLTQLYSDPHSPNQFRVNGVLSLIDDFYEIFNVNKNDKMFIDKNNRIIY